MKKLFLVPLFALILIACSAKHGLINVNPSLANQEGNGDNNLVKAQIDSILKTNGDIQAKLNTLGQAGFNNNQQSVGRDIKTKTVTENDTSLMKAIIGAMSSAILGLLGYIRILAKQKGIADKRLMDLTDAQEQAQQEDRKSTRLNSSHRSLSRMPSSA